MIWLLGGTSLARGEKLGLLEIVEICDNCHIGQPASETRGPGTTCWDGEELVPFFLGTTTESPLVGLLRPQMIISLMKEPAGVWKFQETSGRKWMGFDASIDTPDKRTAAMKELTERWRDTNILSEIIGPKKWRGENYTIYKDPFGAHDVQSLDGNENNYAFEMERSACALFGVVTYGIHMSIFEAPDEENGKPLKIWIPTRSHTKQTWPGYLDNSVAGGIPSGMQRFEALVKEAGEEASIEEHIVRKYAKATGAISYFTRSWKGWLRPEVEYLYEICVPPGVDPTPFHPKPLDGEVESFELLAIDDVIVKMKDGLFKPNCALVILDFLIRHGYITSDNEPDFLKIQTRLHGTFDYSKW